MNNIAAKDCRFIKGFRAVPVEAFPMLRHKSEDEVAKVREEMRAVRLEVRVDVTFNVPALRPDE